MTPTTLEDLSERVAAELTRAQRIVLDSYRALANETRIRDHAAAVESSLAAIETAQAALRAAGEVEREAKAAHDEALADADWSLDDCFTTAGNKTFLVLPCGGLCGGTGGIERDATPEEVSAGHELGVAYDPCTECEGSGQVRKAMTADERKAWKAQAVRQVPAVRRSEAAWRQASLATQQAGDELKQAERRFSAAKHLIHAATAQLMVLGGALPKGGSA